MQIVIDIPDDYIGVVMANQRTEGTAMDKLLRQAVIDGTPLPKGHGRLIDADELYGDFIDGTEGYDCQTWNRIEIGDIIEEASTIIEAERSEECR